MLRQDPPDGPLADTVSVVMAAYNGEQFIAQAISSVLAQTHPAWELIVVDDGSSDNTARIVREFQARDGRIEYLFQPNGGQAKARNAGIRRGRGRFIAFLDQDDLWMREKLELQLQVMGATGVDVVFSDGFIFPDDRVADEGQSFNTISGRFEGPRMFELLFAQNRIPVLSALVRRSALERVGPLDESPRLKNSDDYDLWMMMAAAGSSFYGMERKLVRYRLHSRQASRDNLRMLEADISVIEKHWDEAKIPGRAKRERVRPVYRKVVAELLAQNRPGEAEELLARLSRRKGLVLPTLVERVAVRSMPGRYEFACRKLDAAADWVKSQQDRARAAFSYRVSTPLKRAWRRIAAPVTD